MTDTNHNLPQNKERFGSLSSDAHANPPLRADAPKELEPRLSLQTAIEGVDTPSWIQPRKAENQHIPG